MNNPTPRFYKTQKKRELELDKSSETHYLIVLQKLIEYPGSPMIMYQTIYAGKSKDG